MPSEQLQHPRIPDYQRLHRLTEKIPALDPAAILTFEYLRSVADDLVTRLRANLERQGLTEGRIRVLAILLAKDSPMTHTELAKASGVTKATITGLVNSLERDGLVERSACSGDRRVRFIAVTSEGEAILRDILPGHMQLLSQCLGVMRPDERSKLLNLLEKFHERLAAEVPNPPEEVD